MERVFLRGSRRWRRRRGRGWCWPRAVRSTRRLALASRRASPGSARAVALRGARLPARRARAAGACRCSRSRSARRSCRSSTPRCSARTRASTARADAGSRAAAASASPTRASTRSARAIAWSSSAVPASARSASRSPACRAASCCRTPSATVAYPSFSHLLAVWIGIADGVGGAPGDRAARAAVRGHGVVGDRPDRAARRWSARRAGGTGAARGAAAGALVRALPDAGDPRAGAGVVGRRGGAAGRVRGA